jgi:transcriptional regulator with XRE-family HTH domain
MAGDPTSDPGPSGLPLADLVQAERQAQGLTLERLAAMVRKAAKDDGAYSRAHDSLVCKWCSGELVPTRTHLRALALALGLPIDRVMAAAEAQRKRAAWLAADAGLLTYHGAVIGAFEHALLLGRSDLERPGQVAAVPFSAEALVAASRDWLIHHVDRRLTPTGNGPTGGAGPIRDTFRAFQELDTRHGGGHSRLALVQYVSTYALPLLKDGDRADASLYGATAELLYLAGLTAFDSGSLGLAERYFIHALRLAEEGASRAFAGNVLAAMSHLVIAAGRGDEAVQLARAGLVSAKGAKVPGVLMRLHLMEARGHALRGDEPGGRAALYHAQVAWDMSDPSAGPPWTRFLDTAYLDGEMSQCYRDLRDWKAAEKAARESARSGANDGRGRRRILSQAALAVARLHQRDVGEACHAGGLALDLLEHGVSSWRATQEIARLCDGLRPHRKDPVVRSFSERVREVVGASI